MNTPTTGQIEYALDQGRWFEARRLLGQALLAEPDDHWLVTHMGTAYYEDRDYAAALKWSKKALSLAPNCPLVLWDYACALDMTGQPEEAIDVWEGLIARGVDRLAAEECGEGRRWAESLVNDCRYRIGLSYLDLGRRHEGLAHLRSHLKHRRPGLPSLYSRKEVQRRLQSARLASVVRESA